MEAKLRGLLTELYKTTPCQPIMVRLAWHDAGTYDAATGTGGANGSIRFEPEAGHGANNGLSVAHALIKDIKDAVPEVSYADLYQLAAVVAIEVCGGPKIPFRFGRTDATGPDQCTEDGRLPDATKRIPHLKSVFERMGLTVEDMLVLSGAHCLGRAHKDRSGFEGAWTTDPLKFDNEYFRHVAKGAAPAGLLLLESDKALCDEPKLKALVEAYAESQDKFFEDYAVAHRKLSELGMKA